MEGGVLSIERGAPKLGGGGSEDEGGHDTAGPGWGRIGGRVYLWYAKLPPLNKTRGHTENKGGRMETSLG